MIDQDIAQAEPSIDLPDWLRAVIALDPGADVLQFEGRWRTWQWLDDAVAELDALLTRAGLVDGATVGMLMRNRPEIVRTITAAIATRRCLVTLSSAVPMAKLATEVARMRLPAVVAAESDWTDEVFAAAVRDAGSLGIVVTDGEPVYRIIIPLGDRGADAVDTAPGVAVQMLTSGTTGPPKRIDLFYRSLESEIESTAHYGSSNDLTIPRLSSGTSLIWNPLLHIGGLRALIISLVAGRKIALLERFSVAAWAEMVREHQLRVVSLVPAALAMVLDADLPRDTFDSVEVAYSGTAPLDPEIARQFEEKYGVPVLVVYGATEFAGGVAGWTLADWRRHRGDKVGSVGRPNHGVSVRIVDVETGREQPRGAVGLLEVKAPQLVEPGWARTTDLARMDDDEFIWIVGRADDVIVRGGFKVAAPDVRAAIVEHPSVLDACVIGIPDRRLGQVPVAAVELRPEAEPVSSDELLTWARERLSGYQVPVEMLILDHLPRTPSMKVSQGELRPLFATNQQRDG